MDSNPIRRWGRVALIGQFMLIAAFAAFSTVLPLDIPDNVVLSALIIAAGCVVLSVVGFLNPSAPNWSGSFGKPAGKVLAWFGRFVGVVATFAVAIFAAVWAGLLLFTAPKLGAVILAQTIGIGLGVTSLLILVSYVPWLVTSTGVAWVMAIVAFIAMVGVTAFSGLRVGVGTFWIGVAFRVAAWVIFGFRARKHWHWSMQLVAWLLFIAGFVEAFVIPHTPVF